MPDLNIDLAEIKKSNIKRLRELAPEILLIFPDSITKAWLSIWEPYLLNQPYKFAVIANNYDNKDISNILSPLFFTKEGITIGQLLKIKSLKIFLYPTNRPNNFGYINKFPYIKHVFIGHGDSDKLSSSSRFSTVYDYLFVADSQAHLRYAMRGVKIPYERFINIGAPTLPNLNVLQKKINAFKNILYAPTSEGKAADSNFSSLLNFNIFDDFANLSKKYDIDFRPHPGMGERLELYKKIRSLLSKAYSKKLQKQDAFNRADIIICDISGVMSEFLFTNKPIIVPYDPDSNLINSAIKNSEFKKYVYLWNVKSENLEDLILSIEQDDFLFELRSNARKEKFLNAMNFDDSSTNFNNAIKYVALSQSLN